MKAPAALHWLIQQDGGRNGQRLHDACQALAQPATLLDVGDEGPLPEPEGPVLLYGSTGFVRRACTAGRWRPGAWEDPQLFRHQHLLQHLGAHLLNASAQTCLLHEIPSRLAGRQRVFLRGDDDHKRLTGAIWRADELQAYVDRLLAAGNDEQLSLPVVLATRQHLSCEWRLFVVSGQVVAGSQYRRHGDLEVRSGLTAEVRAFGTAMAERWSPLPAFVLDVAATDEGLRVVELNGFHSAGIYGAEPTAIVGAVAAYWGSRC